MIRASRTAVLFGLATLPALLSVVLAEEGATELELPVEPQVFIDAFDAAEGLTFSAEGRLYIGANQAIWHARPDGSVERVTDVIRHLGQARIGERDILAADFGPSIALVDGPGTDGIIWRVTPEGVKTVAARGIGDPNAILGRKDGSFLVSDDFTNNIYLIETDGSIRLFTDAIPYPNGLALSPDESVLYAAQIFTGLTPRGFSDQLWALPLEGGEPAGPAKVVARTGGGGLDGLAMDELGRVYIADNGAAEIWRYDPAADELVLVAEGVPSAASLVFGEGEGYDAESLYVTSGGRGGGTIWRIPVGARGVAQRTGGPLTESLGREFVAGFRPPPPIVLSLSGDFATRPTVRRALVALHHGWFEAARDLFRAATEAAPEFALAYWGEAMSHYDPTTGRLDLRAGQEALARLERLAREALESRGTPAERALVDSAARLFRKGSRAERERDLAMDLLEASARLPHEAEIAVLAARSLLGRSRDEPSDDDAIEAAAMLEEVLDLYPSHPGALHFLVHAYDRLSLEALARRPRRRYLELVRRDEPDRLEHPHTASHLEPR